MGEESIRKAILLKYDTFGECAEAIGITKSQMSRSLKKPSSKFLAKLEEAGVIIQREGTVSNTADLSNEEKVILEYKTIIYEKNKLIEEQRSIIEQKDKIILQYEELNKAHRRRE